MKPQYSTLANTENVFLGCDQLHSIWRLGAPKVGSTYSSQGDDVIEWEVTYIYSTTGDTSTVPYSQPGVLRDIRNAHYPEEYVTTHTGGPYSVPLRTIKHTDVMYVRVDDTLYETVYVQYTKRIIKPPCGLSWKGLWPLSMFMPAVTVRKEYAVFTKVRSVTT